MRLFTTVIILTTALVTGIAASGNAQLVSIQRTDASLEAVISDLRAQTGYGIVANLKALGGMRITLERRNVELAVLLDELSKQAQLTYTIDHNDKFVFIEPAEASKKATDRRVTLALAFQESGGRVVDTLGRGLPGASVRVLNAARQRTTLQTTTDHDGYFKLSHVPEDAVLEVTYIGYVKQELPAAAQLGTIVLRALPSALEEVVVNKGYYTENRKLSTGSVGRVSGETIAQQPVTNVMGALIGRIPGLEVTQGGGVPGAGFQIRIRGQNSIAAGKSPMFIIDGVPFSSESLGYNQVSRQLPFIDGVTAVSPFNTLNPADIANIEVLKDADATAIYGSRGANGVILITTKKGQAGKTKFDFNLNSSFSRAPSLMDMVDTETYLAIRREAYANDGVSTYPATAFDVNGTWPEDRYTDWQDELLGNTAKNINFQGAVSGGSEQTQFLVRGGYQRENTIFPGGFHYDRGSVLANVNHRSADKRFTLNLSAGYNTDDNNMISADYTRSASVLAPNSPATYTAAGQLNWEYWPTGIAGNPMVELEKKYTGSTHHLNTNLVLSYQVLPGLELKTSLGYSDFQLDEFLALPSTQYNPESAAATSRNASAFRNTGNRQGWIVEPQASWKRDLGGGVLDVLVGSTFQHQTSGIHSQLGSNFPSNALIYDLTAASNQSVLRTETTLYKYQALFGRLNYNWHDKYLVNLTARRDGSSRFSPERQFANFGAVGAAWLFTNEPAIQQALPFLSFGKLRGSYGITGNDQIGDYQFLDTYTTNGNNYNEVMGLLPQYLYNPNFGWETNRKLEASLELGLWRDRLFLINTWYLNRSSNQLVGIPLPGLTGFPSIQSNLDAEVQNSGWEFELQATPVQSGKLTWRTAVNLTIPHNKLLAFPNLAASTYANTYVVGQPLTIKKAYHLLGIDPETGIYQYEDVNGDGQLSTAHDRTIIRDVASHFFGGYSNTLSYGAFQFDIFFQFVKKTGYNYLYYINQPGMTIAGITKEAADGIWRPGRTDATIQKLTAGGNVAARNAWSRLYTSDAAISDLYFIRLKNVALSYQLKKDWLWGGQARVFVQGQNLFTLTDYLGSDPETTLYSNLPPLKTVNIGAQITF